MEAKITTILAPQSGDENCEALVSVLKEVVHSLMPSFPTSLTLDKYISPNYMGLFLTEHQEELLKKLAISFVKEASHLCEYLSRAVVAPALIFLFYHVIKMH